MSYQILKSESDTPPATTNDDNETTYHDISLAQPSTPSRNRHYLTNLNVLLVLLQLTLLTYYTHLILTNPSKPPSSPPYPVTVPTVFGRNHSYMSLAPQYDSLWSSPPIDSAGAIRLKSHNGRFRDDENGVIAMFHQLHCLKGLREALQQGHEGKLVAVDWRLARHWPHCLWYLRESILCWGDGFVEHEEEMMVEGQGNGDGDGWVRGFVDGASDVRQCRDIGPLFERYERENAAQYDVHLIED